MSLSKSQLLALTVTGMLCLSGCALFKKKPQAEQPPSTTDQVAELRTQVTQLQAKIDQLEGKLAAATARSEAPPAPPRLDSPPTRIPPKATGVYPHPTEGAGASISSSLSSTDPEYGFINDEAIDLYRKSKILLESRKYAEAVLSFSSFLEQYPDHPLAGSAQYHIGESYYRQKEYKLALQEFRRVITSYDRSPNIAATLRLMIETEEALKMPQEAARHRHQLNSLFPQAPVPDVAVDAAPVAPAPAASPTPQAAEPTRGAAFDPVPTGHAAMDETPPTAPIQRVTKPAGE